MKLGTMYLWGSARRNNAAVAHTPIEDDDTSPLLVSRDVPIEDTPDRQLRNYVMHSAHYFHQWKHTPNEQIRSQMRILLTQLTDMLPAFLGARDYAAAGQVLSILYHRFSVTPAMCAQTSLEILRRQEDMDHDLVAFYRTAMEDRRLDKLVMLKELWTYYIIQGDFYEAYHLYHDEIQEIDISDDHRLFANYGVLCYWLLLVESSEIRDKLRKDENEDLEDDEDDDADGYADMLPKVEDIESLIESKYAFKSPIGVHILYQGATNALRRAVGLSPGSALFLEYYIQLLVLVGDISTACDYLENYYRTNAGDPHGARMLVGFLEKYYPDSGEEQARIYARWMRNDPAALFPLERLMDLYGAGSVSTDIVVEAIANSLDTCGGDLYLTQNPVVCVTLWRHFAETIVAIDEEELTRTYDGEEVDADNASRKSLSRGGFLADFGAQHQWWKRVYFAKPAKLDDVTSMTAAHSDLLDVWIFRAAVADRVFPEYSPSTEVLRQAVKLPVDAVKSSHVRLFKSFFGMKFADSADLPSTPENSSFPKSVTNIERSSLVPIMTGDPITSRVLPRSLIVKDTQHAKRGLVKIAVDTEAGKVDEELSAELQRAVEYHSIRTEEEALRGSIPDGGKNPGTAKRYKERRLTVPLYINLIEEATYCNPRMTTRHLFQTVLEKLQGTSAILPTLLEVDTARRVFVVRWMRNLQTYGNYGLLMRYEGFIMRHILIEMLHGRRDFPASFADELLIQMKRELPSSHMHFPDHQLMKVTIPRLVKAALRLRRRKFFEVRNAMRGLCQQVVKLTYEDLVEIAWEVCTKNHLTLFLTRDQVCKLAYTAIGTHYKWVVRTIHLKTRKAISAPKVVQLTDPVERYCAVKAKTTYFHVYAMMWLDKYQRRRAEEGEAIDSDEERVYDELSRHETTDRGWWTRQKRREVRRASMKYTSAGLQRRTVGGETEGGHGSEATAARNGERKDESGKSKNRVGANAASDKSDDDAGEGGYTAADDENESDDGRGSDGDSTESDRTLPEKYRVADVTTDGIERK